jgi:GDPmannose 4,6-dehydratase
MRVLITGVGGQDGQILAPMLGELGHEVFGLVRVNKHIDQIQTKNPINLIHTDLSHFDKILEILRHLKPELIINFGAFSSVKDSWIEKETVFRINYELPLFIYNWMSSESPETRFIQASSSEIFGSVSEEPQNEETALRPLTPYGHSKAKAHEAGIHFRNKENLRITNLILYNHESTNRSRKFVSRHVSQGAAAISLGFQDYLEIGNIAARRDWGWAPDYMNAICNVINSSIDTEFILATGKTNSVGEMMEFAFETIGIQNYMDYVRISASELRMADPVNLKGNPAKAMQQLKWAPSQLLRDFMPLMVLSDIEKFKKGTIRHEKF